MEFLSKYWLHIMIGLTALAFYAIGIWSHAKKTWYKRGRSACWEEYSVDLFRLRSETTRLRNQNDELIAMISNLILKGEIPVLKIPPYQDKKKDVEIKNRPAEQVSQAN